MATITDLTLYKNKVYLELCLDLVEDAYTSLKKGHFDLAESQLHDILATFEEDELEQAACLHNAKVLFCTSRKI
jgi:hypothetical protein